MQTLPTAVCLIALLGCAAAPAAAQAPTGRDRPFEITDNSFLVEEAFNQERGIFQNIFTATHTSDGRWDGSYTQEWPVPGMTHQFSYTVPFSVASGSGGVGDVLLNYRFQALHERAGVPAFSPRLSLMLPTGDSGRGLGTGSVGWQVNLPFSKQFGDVYMHWNAGATYVPDASAPAAGTASTSLFSPTAAASAIVRVRPMLNLMCEFVASSEEQIVESGASERERSVTVSPGLRGGWNFGERQLIVGVAAPITFTRGEGHEYGLLTYLSYELPFRKVR